jgi:hypothetical protein
MKIKDFKVEWKLNWNNIVYLVIGWGLAAVFYHWVI